MGETNSLRNLWHTLWSYSRLAGTGDIARRYFAMNAFDGVLTMIGVLMGNMTAGVLEPHIVVSTGLSTSVAMGVSGLWGTWLTESAERKRELVELSRQTLTDLNTTRIGRSHRFAAVVIALVDGLSPFLAALLILLPFFAADLFPSIQAVYYSSIGLALVALFCLGLFLGHISHENRIRYGIKTIIAGVVSIIISSYLSGRE